MAKGQPLGSKVPSDNRAEIDKWFNSAIKADASDLHLKVGQCPKMRVRTKLKDTSGEVLTAKRIEKTGLLILDTRLVTCTAFASTFFASEG